MRYRSCLSSRRRKRPPQYGIRALIVGVAIISVLLAVGEQAWALLVCLTGVLVVVTDWAATKVPPQPRPGDHPDIVPVRRFWHRSSMPRNIWLTFDPVIFVIVYVSLFLTWHLMLLMCFDLDGARRFFDLSDGVGMSLRVVVHSVNAMVLAYLLVHLAASLFPHAQMQRIHRIPILVAMVAMAIATAMHFAVF